MPTSVGHGITISVRPRFEEGASHPVRGRFLFSYRIAIANTGPKPVRLLRRHWTILDSLGPRRTVNGAGVVGITPAIAPGERFEYGSACDLRGPLGRMEGRYLMEQVPDGERFWVAIPPFDLCWPHLAN